MTSESAKARGIGTAHADTLVQGEGDAVEHWIRWLTISGTVVGALVVVYGFVRFVALGTAPPLLIAVAILIVGPGEDIMQRWARRTGTSPADGELRATIVDRATSLAFLVLLGVTIWLV